MSRSVWLPAAIVGIAAALSGRVEAQPNILLIIGDDMGVDALASYGVGEELPTTPVLAELARDGMRFTNFWAQPVCSPTRATVLTGRYGFRTGIGRPAGGGMGLGLPDTLEEPAWASAESPGGPSSGSDAERALPRPHLLAEEYTMPLALQANGYSTAAIGKWHLASPLNGGLRHPNLVGFDHFSGLMGGAPESYFSWIKVVNGEGTAEIGYTPSDKADDALAWLDGRGDDPWFLWFAFNLAHTPLHRPPEEVWRSDHSDLDPHVVPPEERWRAYFVAMMEAMDTQIGRLLGSLDPEVRENTYVIFMGDNGTENEFVSPPFTQGRAKGTIYEGGVNVPLIVTGPGIAQGTVSDALVNSTDLFTTIMEMADIDPDEAAPDGISTDSVSFLYALSDSEARSRREWIYADEFYGGFDGVLGADYAMRNARYKLLRFQGNEEFYDLQEDPYEHNNLLAGELSEHQRAEHRSLREQISALRDSEPPR